MCASVTDDVSTSWALGLHTSVGLWQLCSHDYLLELQPGTYSVTGSVSGHAGFTTGAARGRLLGVDDLTGSSAGLIHLVADDGLTFLRVVSGYTFACI